MTGRQLVRTLVACLSLLLGGGAAQAGGAPTETQTQREVMYTLTVTFVGQEDERLYFSDGRRVSGETSRLTTYVARTTRPVALTRLATGSTVRFDFEAKLRGTVTHTGGGWGSVYRTCHWRVTEAARSVKVEGTVSPSRTRPNPSPLYVDLDLKPWSNAVTRSYEPEGEDCDPSTRAYTESVSTLLPQAPRWNGPLEFFYTKSADLNRSFGRAFTISHGDRHTFTAKSFGVRRKEAVRSYLWLITFVPVKPVETERWQVDVRGEDTDSWGRTATLGAGVRVQWLHRTDLTIEDGEVTKATAKVTVEKVTPFSTPDGVFVVTPARTKTYPAYTPRKAVKRGKLIELQLWREPGSFYRVDFTVKLGPQALERMRAAGVPDPEAMIASITRPVSVTEITPVPFYSRLVAKLTQEPQTRETEAFSQIPCKKGLTKKECFLRRGGETILVRRVS